MSSSCSLWCDGDLTESDRSLIVTYPWLKAGHIIFVIFWIAGLFMLPRYYIYHQESRAWLRRGEEAGSSASASSARSSSRRR